MKKKLYGKNPDLEDTLIDNDFSIPILKKLNFESNHKIISFISEYMSLPLNEKIAHYIINKNIRTLKNPLTSDTLFHYICINDDNFPLIKLMKPNIEEIEIKNNSGQNLLHIAVNNKCEKIVKYLIENGVNVNSKDFKNNTAMHYAVKNNDYNMVKILIFYNAKINEYNNDKETPIDIAKKKKNNLIINYLESKSKKKKTNLIINNKELSKENFNMFNIMNRYNQSNLNTQNISLNNFSDETKNETENQSLNVYKKKVILKNTKTPLTKKIRCNRTISLNNLNFNNNDNTPNKKISIRYINEFSPKILEPKLIYRRNSPGIINKRKSFKEKNKFHELNVLKLSPELIQKNSEQFKLSLKNSKSHLNLKTQKSQNKKNNFKTSNNQKRKLKNIVLQNNVYNPNSIPINLRYNNVRTRNTKKLNINHTFNNTGETRNKNDEKNKIIEFLKEIGMQQYTNMLLSEGYDDIDLIIKQMNEGFPSLYDTLKEIGVTSPGDRAKILVHIQEISKGFNFEFPFEQVYFKNNRSIQRWLNREELSKYINNFIDAGYQSLELLLIQMASKYKINEQILREELFIYNEEDINKILKSLVTNSEKYIYQLRKNQNVQRTYSKMVNNNSGAFCIII